MLHCRTAERELRVHIRQYEQRMLGDAGSSAAGIKVSAHITLTPTAERRSTFAPPGFFSGAAPLLHDEKAGK
ncbi:hypothetical protein CRUP_014551 [Coryphaenoides rupestris]|nr:hypothetical protein CRUP_014551 [Coryphaenoides rupestris]